MVMVNHHMNINQTFNFVNPANGHAVKIKRMTNGYHISMLQPNGRFQAINGNPYNLNDVNPFFNAFFAVPRYAAAGGTPPRKNVSPRKRSSKRK
jgi:hypothetical protein